ncbi:MAG: hypothetical protein U0531_19020 [Dehalococcoidia bacterium]
MDASEDAPTLEAAYKLVAYEGRPVLKLSAGKESWVEPKQVWRRAGPEGCTGDILAVADEPAPTREAEPLLEPVMRDGRRLRPPPTLAAVRERAATERARLPAGVRQLVEPARYPVEPSATLRARQDAARAAVEG